MYLQDGWVLDEHFGWVLADCQIPVHTCNRTNRYQMKQCRISMCEVANQQGVPADSSLSSASARARTSCSCIRRCTDLTHLLLPLPPRRLTLVKHIITGSTPATQEIFQISHTTCNTPSGKASMDNTKIGETVSEKWRDLRMKDTRKLNWYVLTITDIFLNQKRY